MPGYTYPGKRVGRRCDNALEFLFEGLASLDAAGSHEELCKANEAILESRDDLAKNHKEITDYLQGAIDPEVALQEPEGSPEGNLLSLLNLSETCISLFNSLNSSLDAVREAWRVTRKTGDPAYPGIVKKRILMASLMRLMKPSEGDSDDPS